MELSVATASLAALAHYGRLSIFRLLVNAGCAGLAAGHIARQLGVKPNTLSANLTVLSHAGLVTSRREGRSIIYAARMEHMRELLEFLVGDCCAGAPEICAPLAETLRSASCACEPRGDCGCGDVQRSTEAVG